MNFGAFTLVILLESKGYAGESVSDFNGLARKNMPAAAGLGGIVANPSGKLACGSACQGDRATTG